MATIPLNVTLHSLPKLHDRRGGVLREAAIDRLVLVVEENACSCRSTPKICLFSMQHVIFGNVHWCSPNVLTSVPCVVTVRPGQFRLKAVDQIEECPGQDDYVVHAAMQYDHLAGIAETCANIRVERTSTIPRCQRSLQFKLFYNHDWTLARGWSPSKQQCQGNKLLLKQAETVRSRLVGALLLMAGQLKQEEKGRYSRHNLLLIYKVVLWK